MLIPLVAKQGAQKEFDVCDKVNSNIKKNIINYTHKYNELYDAYRFCHLQLKLYYKYIKKEILKLQENINVWFENRVLQSRSNFITKSNFFKIKKNVKNNL